MHFDGLDAAELARRCGVPRVALFPELASTMDAAHELAGQGAPAGTVVLTDRQTAGRGRAGRSWTSAPGQSVTMTLIERPNDPDAVAVLSLRLGLRAARVLDRQAASRVQIKWPNDLMLSAGKLGGILVEARWRHQRLEWVAIGVGINVASPGLPGTAGLAPETARLELLAELLPVLRGGATTTGGLTARELEEYASRDWARGREVREPARGVVRGASASGALIVDTANGPVECMAGSLVLTGL